MTSSMSSGSDRLVPEPSDDRSWRELFPRDSAGDRLHLESLELEELITFGIGLQGQESGASAAILRQQVAAELFSRGGRQSAATAVAEELLRANEKIDLPRDVMGRNFLLLGQVLALIGAGQGSVEVLEESISYITRAIRAAESPEVCPDIEVQLARSLTQLWGLTKYIGHLDQAIAILHELDRALLSESIRPFCDDLLGVSLLERAEVSNVADDYGAAITELSSQLTLSNLDRGRRLLCGQLLGRALRLRARVGSSPDEDRDRAIKTLQTAIERDGSSSFTSPTVFSELGASHYERFMSVDGLADLDPSLEAYAQALLATPVDDPGFSNVRLRNLLNVVRLSTAFTTASGAQLRSIALLEAAFVHAQDLLPGGRNAFCVDLALLFHNQYQQTPHAFLQYWIRFFVDKVDVNSNWQILKPYDHFFAASVEERLRSIGGTANVSFEKILMALIPASDQRVGPELPANYDVYSRIRYGTLFDFHRTLLAKSRSDVGNIY